MKTSVIVFGISLFLFGCASNQAPQELDSFVSLHSLVKQKLGVRSVCEPIDTDPRKGTRSFHVQPQPRGLSITVWEREFLTPAEWEKRYVTSTDLWLRLNSMIATNHPSNLTNE